MKKKLYSFILSQNIFIEEDVFSYGYDVVTTYTLFLLILLPLSILNHTIIETLIFIFIFISLRRYLGGLHFNSHKTCMLFSIIVSLLIPYINSHLNYINIIIRCLIFFIAFLSIYFIGVTDHKNKRLNTAEKKIFKHHAIILLCLYFLIGNLFYSKENLQYLNILFVTIAFFDINLLITYILNKKSKS